MIVVSLKSPSNLTDLNNRHDCIISSSMSFTPTKYETSFAVNATWDDWDPIVNVTSVHQSDAGRSNHDAVAMALIVLSLLVVIVGTVVGNILVCVAVCLVRKLRRPYNYLLVSLAVSDLCVAILVMPMALLYELLGEWQFGKLICDVWVSFDVLSCTASILNLCMISVDRYLAITKPLQYGVKRTPTRMIAYIVFVWISAAFISVPPVLILGNEHGDGSVCQVCQNFWYQIYATFGSFYIPLTVMVTVYFKIFQAAKRIVDEERKAQAHLKLVEEQGRQYQLQQEQQLLQHSKSNHSNIREKQRASFLCQSSSSSRYSVVQIHNGEVETKLTSGHDLHGSSGSTSAIDDWTQASPPNSTFPTIARNHQLPCSLQACSSSRRVNADENQLFNLPLVAKNLCENSSPLSEISSCQSSWSMTTRFAHIPKEEKSSWSLTHNSKRNNIVSLTLNPRYEEVASAETRERGLSSHLADRTFGGDKVLDISGCDQVASSNKDVECEVVMNALKFTKISSIKRLHQFKSNDLAIHHTISGSPGRSASDSSSQILLCGMHAIRVGGRQSTTIDAASPRRKLAIPHKSRLRITLAKERKASTTLGIIMSAFIICWLPFFVLALVRPFLSDPNAIPNSVSSLFLWLGYANSLLNPIIYATLNKDFRKPFQEILCLRCSSLNILMREEFYHSQYGQDTPPQSQFRSSGRHQRDDFGTPAASVEETPDYHMFDSIRKQAVSESRF